MKKRIWFKNEGQDLEYLDVDTETGRILNVSPTCSPSVANIYIGNHVDLNHIVEDEAVNITDVNNGGKKFKTRYYVESIEQL